ncbi:hypothetical protein S40288_03785 [Stachybotrys chartarum IBT 40288]|nr:hypothetical protein S40288_03785 [Stachybotrys chartarum IBT 40288]
MVGFNDAPLIQKLAVPAVCLLISFLGYVSQLVFQYSALEPGLPSQTETVVFNSLLLLLWYAYYKAVTVDPGQYVFPEKVMEAEGRWCNKCTAPKPLRAHHCKLCKRCVPRMDHHCPWTGNCVSMTTFPHFLRFLVYTNMSLWMLGHLLWQRFYAIWQARHLPAYLGPSVPALVTLAMLSIICFFTTFALGIILITTVRSWVLNRTMIEGWELERHEAIADRPSKDWWEVTGPDGKRISFERVEFPYDVGFLTNMSQAMGTSNPFLWFYPFSSNPIISKTGKGSGWTWEENGFNRMEGMWPPPDPDKIRRAGREWPAAGRNLDAELRELDLSPEEAKRAFKKRQEQDAKRRRMLMAELEEQDDFGENSDYEDPSVDKGWSNTDGDRLGDFGVDEDAYDVVDADESDDNVPLGELLRRRNVVVKDSQE